MAYFDNCNHHIGQIKTVCLESKHQILAVKTSPYPRIYPTFGLMLPDPSGRVPADNHMVQYNPDFIVYFM